MTRTSLREVVVEARPLTPEAYAPYGRLIGPQREPLLQQEGSFTAKLMTVHRVPATLTGINRHRDHSQTFVPLAGAPTVLIVAPPDVPAEGFDPERIVAFVNRDGYAFTFDPGTWHTEPRALGADSCDLINIQTDVSPLHTDLLHLEADCGVRVVLRVPGDGPA
ncbi:MAG TPA: ureidoglycolate lyase [Chloroflexota bacterium]|nr:ureidoglycolate lyase [Chloroflexota bacterium]